MAMEYGTSLYTDNDVYRVLRFGNRQDWLKGRLTGIGGSDASAAMNLNRWKNARDLWAIKTGREKSPDISDSPYVQYGVAMEPLIRESFAIDYADQYEVQYMEDVTLQNIEHPWMLYSPDGLIIEKATGRCGIFEAKTHAIRSSDDWDAWRDRIGYDEYFIQILHGLAVTHFEFVDLRVELKRSNAYKQIRTYHIDLTDDGITDQISYIEQTISDFWNNYVLTDTEPHAVYQL